MVERVAKTREEMIAKLEKVGIKIPDKLKKEVMEKTKTKKVEQKQTFKKSLNKTKKKNKTKPKKTPESKKLREFFPGVGVTVVLLIIGLIIIFAVVEGPKLLNSCENDFLGKCIQAYDFKFLPPEGWETETNTSDGFLINCVGPDEYGSQSNFNIQAGHTTGAFDEVVTDAIEALEAEGVELQSIAYNTTIGGKPGKRIQLRYYLQEKGYYAKGAQIYVDKGSGNYLMITFFSKDSTYYSNEDKFEKSMDSLIFTD